MLKMLLVLLAVLGLALPVQAQLTVSAHAPVVHQWTGLNMNPLKNPDDPAQIRKVIHKFTVYPFVVADALANLIIRGQGVPGQICKGNRIPGMSFGDGEVWNGTVEVVWSNNPRQCEPVTRFEFPYDNKIYTAIRVRACKNLGALYPRDIARVPQPVVAPGPDYSGIPRVECPSRQGETQPSCC